MYFAARTMSLQVKNIIRAAMQGIDISQKNTSDPSMEGITVKFMPKYDVKKVSGKKMIVARVVGASLHSYRYL